MSRALRNGRASAAVAVETPVRIAIYARKSTTEGMGSGFSSIDAQRRAAENFVASQVDRGWVCLPQRYDDFGFSGGSMERPAITQLLADVSAGLIDVLVTARLDRVSRNLADFVRFHEFLTKRGVALVSVAESIDSSTAHGKMLIGILATFAEYERSLASARTRDKIRGAKQKGRFCGGAPVLGFDCDPKGAQLVVNAAEATMVREIFELFLANKSLVATVAEMDRRGWTLKKWVTRAGKEFGGGRVDVHNLRRLLGNHVYEGRVLFEGKLYDGEHAAIVSSKVFHEVQRILDAGRRDTRPGAANKYGCLLRGLLFCGCGSPMVHAPTKKGHRVHRYYRCGATMRRGAATCPTRALRALDIESFVVGRIRAIGQDASLREQTFREAVDQLAAQKRSLNREAKRLTRGLAATERHVEDLVATLSRATGPVAEAVEAEIAKAKTRTAAAEERLRTVRAEAGGLGAVSIDEADLARALADFDGLWSVLLTAERERLLGVLISAVRYDGANGRLEIDWRLAGFGELAAEVTGA